MAVEAGPKQGRGLGGGWGQCSGPIGLEKAPQAVGGWGLGSRNRRGPGMPPTPCLRGQGTSPGSPAGFLGSSGRGKCPLLSCFSSPGGPLPPASPVLPLASFLSPQGRCSGGGVGREGPWRAGDRPGSSAGSLAPSGWGKRPLLLSCSSRRAPPARLS